MDKTYKRGDRTNNDTCDVSTSPTIQQYVQHPWVLIYVAKCILCDVTYVTIEAKRVGLYWVVGAWECSPYAEYIYAPLNLTEVPYTLHLST